MEQEEHNSQKEALEVSRDSEDILQDLPVAVTSMQLLLSLNLVNRLLVLDLDVRVIGREVAQLAKIG